MPWIESCYTFKARHHVMQKEMAKEAPTKRCQCSLFHAFLKVVSVEVALVRRGFVIKEHEVRKFSLQDISKHYNVA